MDLQVRCPSCKTLLNVPGTLAGKKIRCTKCDKVLTAPGGSSPERETSKEAIAPRSRMEKSAAPPRSDPDDDYRVDDSRSEDRARGKSSSKRRQRDKSERPGSLLGLWLAIGGGSLVIIAITVVVLILLTRPDPPPPALPEIPVVAQKQMPQQVFPPFQQFPGGVPLQPGIDVMPQEIPQVLPGGPAGGPPAVPLDKEVVEKVKQSTVYLRVTMGNGQVGEGSGFLALEPGLVLTNAHVVGMLLTGAAPPKNIEVVLHSGIPEKERTLQGKLLSAESAVDLAIVQVDGGAEPLPPPLPLESASNLAETQDVYVFGFPFGRQLGKAVTANRSSVSAVRRNAGGSIAQIQVQGGMYPGNSGGPVVDSRGNVVGVSVAVILGTQINFAVPADLIQSLVGGRVRDTEMGIAYRSGEGIKLPIRVVCADPLQRVQDVQVDVWAGPEGKARPASSQPPAPQPGDSAKKTVKLTYRDGSAAADIDVPEAPLGAVVWVQPAVAGQAGLKLWGPSVAYAAERDPPVERVPIDFQTKNLEPPERTLDLKATRKVILYKNKFELVISEQTQAALLEHLQSEPRGISVHLHPHDVQVARTIDNKTIPVLNHAPLMVEQMLFSFLMSPEGALKERGSHAGLDTTLPAPVKMEIDGLFNNLANGYEATCLTAPRGATRPLATWKSRLPILLPTQGKSELADMNLTCTYEGRRKQDDAEFALVRLAGEVRSRGPKSSDVGGKVTGHALFDLAQGYFAQAKLVVDSELAAAGGILARHRLEIQLSRQPGNAKQIVKLDPKAPLPVVNITLPNQPIPLVNKGAAVLELEGELTAADPREKRSPANFFKEHRVKLSAGVNYVIEMNSPDPTQLDPFLRLETTQGAIVAYDDDSGGNLNARILYTPKTAGDYRIIATGWGSANTGPYTLTVAEVAKGAN
jgi:S1-C subfamily serine protease